MNIHDVAYYLKLGYRARRKSWDTCEFCYDLADVIEKKFLLRVSIWNPETKQHEKCDFIEIENYSPSIYDLMADDWEIITNGIISQSLKENDIEYQEM